MNTTNTQIKIEGVGIVNISAAGGDIEVTICDTQNETVHQSLATESDLTYSFRKEVKRLLGDIDYSIIDEELLASLYREGLSPEMAVEKFYTMNEVDIEDFRFVPSHLISEYSLARSIMHPFIPLADDQFTDLTAEVPPTDFNGIFSSHSDTFFAITHIDNKPVLALLNKDASTLIKDKCLRLR